MLTIKQHLLQNLREISNSTIIGWAVQQHFKTYKDNPIEDEWFLKELISQYEDNPAGMAKCMDQETFYLLEYYVKSGKH